MAEQDVQLSNFRNIFSLEGKVAVVTGRLYVRTQSLSCADTFQAARVVLDCMRHQGKHQSRTCRGKDHCVNT